MSNYRRGGDFRSRSRSPAWDGGGRRRDREWDRDQEWDIDKEWDNSVDDDRHNTNNEWGRNREWDSDRDWDADKERDRNRDRDRDGEWERDRWRRSFVYPLVDINAFLPLPPPPMHLFYEQVKKKAYTQKYIYMNVRPLECEHPLAFV